MIAALLGVLILAASPARSEDREHALELFKQATVAREQGRWPEVRRLLEESNRIYPQFATAWNLVTADEQLGDLPAAETVLLRLKEGAVGKLESKEQSAVAERLGRVARELGTLAIESSEPGSAVHLDGKPRAEVDDAGRLELRVTAGAHLVSVTTRDGRKQDRSFDLARGQQQTLSFEFPPAPALVAPAKIEAARAPPVESSSLWSSPWLWVAIGVVAAGSAVAIGFAAHQTPLHPAEFMVPPL